MQSTILFKVSNKIIQYNSIKETIQTVAYISIINQEPQYNHRKLNFKTVAFLTKKVQKKVRHADVPIHLFTFEDCNQCLLHSQ